MLDATSYLNGEAGPKFFSDDAPIRSRAKDTDWPQWRDRLHNAESSNLIEGGLRTCGIFKTDSDEQPLVSYITVVKNNAVTLARTINSVQDQTYANVEHIILDGASSDGTLDLIHQYANQIDYYVSEPDGGLYEAINKLIPLARGRLICVLNSDDWLEPSAAEIAVQQMNSVQEPSLLFTSAQVKNARGIEKWIPAFVHPGSYFKCANDCHNAIYATRSAYELSGPYDASYKIAADFKWIMTCLDVSITFFYMDKITVNYSFGGVSGDAAFHGVECMRVVGERFPFLTEVEIEGLHSCFFVFPTSLKLVHQPSDKTLFLRRLFATHASRSKFLQTLSWALIEKVEYPSPKSRPLKRLRKSTVSKTKGWIKALFDVNKTSAKL